MPSAKQKWKKCDTISTETCGNFRINDLGIVIGCMPILCNNSNDSKIVTDP